ncbi:hypothetical protein SDC9_148078 [bioreactor metagenome]|uniref:Uncharacterized protein n=1 Tax=bioreactor metagenome TaxID=1076179 RepID=A0A645EHT1_9ZZZZ
MRNLRTRTDQTHVPFEYVEKLWQFVDAGLADKAAKLCFARIILFRPTGVLLRVDAHGAEFVHLKVLFVSPDARLPKNDRPGTGKPHPDGGNQHNRARDQN